MHANDYVMTFNTEIASVANNLETISVQLFLINQFLNKMMIILMVLKCCSNSRQIVILTTLATHNLLNNGINTAYEIKLKGSLKTFVEERT